MQTKKLFLFRHGETDWNKQGIIQGHTDIPLNDTGRAQARALGPVLIDKGIEVIVSSDLVRAVETAQIVAQSVGCPIAYDVRLREAHAGRYQGVSSGIAQADPVWSFWHSPDLVYDKVSLPGGETKEVIKQRILAVINHYAKHQCIAVSSHGVALKFALQALTNNSEQTRYLANATHVELNYDAVAARWIIIE